MKTCQFKRILCQMTKKPIDPSLDSKSKTQKHMVKKNSMGFF